MPAYLITYDLHKPQRDYRPLYQLLHRWSARRLTESLWMADLKGPATEIRRIVADTLDGDDTVAVLEMKLGSDWATTNVAQAAVDWLSVNVTPAEQPAAVLTSFLSLNPFAVIAPYPAALPYSGLFSTP